MSLIWNSQWRFNLLGETSWRNRTLDDPSFYPDFESYRSLMSKMFLFFVPSRVLLPQYHHPPPPALLLSIFLNISCQDYMWKRDVRCPKFISFSRFAIIESQFHQSRAIRGKSIWIVTWWSVCPLENAPNSCHFPTERAKLYLPYVASFIIDCSGCDKAKLFILTSYVHLKKIIIWSNKVHGQSVKQKN